MVFDNRFRVTKISQIKKITEFWEETYSEPSSEQIIE